MQRMLMLLATIMLVFANAGHARTQISISAAPPGGPWYVGMGAYAKVINSLFPELNATVFPGVGTANVVHVGQGKSQVGVTCVALMAAGVEGSEPYKKPQAILGLANFNDLSYQFVGIPEGSGIESIEQMIRDKARARINLGSKPGGYAELFSRWLLDGYGVDRKTIESWGGKLLPLNKNEATALLQNRQLDLELDTSSSSFPPKYQEVLKTTDIRFLPIAPDVVEKLVARHPGVVAAVIPKGHLGGHIDRDLTTFASTNGLIINADIPDDVAYKLAKALHLGASEIGLAFPGWNNITAENMCKGLPIEIHPGAARYYREIGCLK